MSNKTINLENITEAMEETCKIFYNAGSEVSEYSEEERETGFRYLWDRGAHKMIAVLKVFGENQKSS